jgi:hypothetical protein
MLRTFDFAVKGAANKSAQGIALGGVGIAVGVARRPRGARRGSRGDRAALGAGHAATARRSARVSRPRRLLPHRQVSRDHCSPRFQRCSCLLSLLQTKETYRSSISAGSGDRAQRGFVLGRGQESRSVDPSGSTLRRRWVSRSVVRWSALRRRWVSRSAGGCLGPGVLVRRWVSWSVVRRWVSWSVVRVSWSARAELLETPGMARTALGA